MTEGTSGAVHFTKFLQNTVADPDLELRGAPGLDLLALLAFFPSVISFFFFYQNKGGGAGPPDPSPRSATEIYICLIIADLSIFWFSLLH